MVCLMFTMDLIARSASTTWSVLSFIDHNMHITKCQHIPITNHAFPNKKQQLQYYWKYCRLAHTDTRQNTIGKSVFWRSCFIKPPCDRRLPQSGVSHLVGRPWIVNGFFYEYYLYYYGHSIWFFNQHESNTVLSVFRGCRRRSTVWTEQTIQ